MRFRTIRLSEEDAEIFAEALHRRRLGFQLSASQFRAIERLLYAYSEAPETERVYTVSERRERENDP